MPSTPTTRLVFGLEIWLRGTPHEIDAAAAVLAGLGPVLHHGAPHRLRGPDAGREQIYLRLVVRTTYTRPAVAGRRADTSAEPLPGLDPAA